MLVNLEQLSANNVYHLMTQTIIPRPIAWVLTDSGDQNYNLAPFSYFTAVSSAPPLLMFSVGKKPDGSAKDTTVNVKQNKKLVIHIANSDQSKAVTASAATLEHGESELLSTGLETVEFEGFSLPRLKDCHIAFACTLFETQELGETPQTLIFAKIEHIYINDEVINIDDKGRVKVLANKVNPLSRLGGSEYGSLGDIISNIRPK
ncbi:flavin reductase family protein [Psychrosphaera aquimarina]|uniref:Flavin reductase family protein n=1 Tax=Psychrosphaera aquimarina TaxID=2044854 RepID=A0ABU3R4V5_9GAMM|nr:flavin reductase family protein [Psychrosphaera aquimarina]MDU0114716.1 flavin reductase family protein [Psychrosphaera aquimarina]